MISRRSVPGSSPLTSTRPLDFVHEIVAREEPRRDVHRDAERLAEHPLPRRRLAAGVAEHRIGERHDEAGLLGDRDEIGRPDHPAAGTRPAHERLEAADLRRGQLDDRLVDEREVVALDRLAQLGLERQALHRRGVHVRVEDLIAAAARRLGAIHGDVGVAQQFVHGGVCAGRRRRRRYSPRRRSRGRAGGSDRRATVAAAR